MKQQKNICLVVPTIRENNFNAFIDRWNESGLFQHVDLIVMEDNPKKTFKFNTDLPCRVLHLCWEDIEDELGAVSWIIPRRSDTVRSFGYYKAWLLQYEYTLTLDDDCYPDKHFSASSLINYHLQALNSKSKWFNTLNNVKPRGIPFYNVGKRTDVIVNHGLWTKVLDYDAPTQLVSPVEETFDFSNAIVPQGSFFPMCGMNVMWKTDYTVLMYHLLMGQMISKRQPSAQAPAEEGEVVPYLTKLPFDRFGDIWCGIFMKKIADMMGRSVSTGTPYIEHQRASDPFVNLMKEANGIAVNEKFWEYVDKFVSDLEFKNDPEGIIAAEHYLNLGKYVSEFKDNPFPEYFKMLGEAMHTWAYIFGAR